MSFATIISCGVVPAFFAKTGCPEINGNQVLFVNVIPQRSQSFIVYILKQLVDNNLKTGCTTVERLVAECNLRPDGGCFLDC